MSRKMDRRKFLQMTAASAAAVLINGQVRQVSATSPSKITQQTITYQEAPALHQLVSAGLLPPVGQRLPNMPLVLTPIDNVKHYGGYLRTMSSWLGGDMEESQYGHSPLRWINDGLEIAPGMCDSWSTNANNTLWTLHIREGLKWSDGVAVTVDDVLFCWNDLVNANYPGAPDAVPDYGTDGVNLAVFTKLDPYTLQISYRTPAPLTGYRLAMWVKGNIGSRWIAPAHYLKQFHPKYNPTYTDFSVLLDKIRFKFNPDCPSLDPWICAQYTPPSQTAPGAVVWKRNPYYYAIDPDGRQLPYLDGVTESGNNGHDNELDLVKSGQIDFSIFHSFSLMDIPNLQSGQGAGKYEVRFWDGGSGTGMVYFWNYDHPDSNKRALFRSPQFKQAMSLALDRPTIQTNVYHDYGFRTTGTMSPKALEFNYNDEARSRFIQYRDAYVNYDPTTAKALLDAINVKDVNNDGWREYPDGTPLTINIDLPNDASGECWSVLNIALPNWQAIGLNVQPNVMPGSDFSSLWHSGQGDIHTNWEIGDGPNHLVYPSWMVPNETDRWAPLCGMTLAVKGTNLENTDCGVDPWTRTPPRYCAADIEYAGTPVEQIQQIYLQAIVEPDLLKRIQYVWQILDIHKANVFYMGTVANTPRIVVVSNNLANVPTHNQLTLGGFVNPWIVPSPAITNPETWSFLQNEQIYLPTIRR